jgi:hypothetical protein
MDMEEFITPRFKQKITQELVELGAQYGDEETLMRAKADCLCEMLRRIVEEVPDAQYVTKLPEKLSSRQEEAIGAALREAVQKGVQLVLTHALRSINDSMYDLCTSKLAARPNA